MIKRIEKYCNSWVDANEEEVRDCRISVVIPVFYPYCLNKVLEHLTSLEGIYEVVLVDDSGNMNLNIDVIHEINVKIVHHRENLGRAAARNTGAMWAEGQVLLFLDQDMFLNPSFIGRAYGLLKANKNAAIILGLRDTKEIEEIENSDIWEGVSVYADWRRKIKMETDFLDLTCKKVGGLRKKCELNEEIDIYKRSNKLRNLGTNSCNVIGFWDLPSMVVSHTMLMHREFFIKCGGFPEWIIGWGGEDIVLGFKAVSNNLKIILTEIVSVQANHIPYSDSEEQKKKELKNNIMKYQEWAIKEKEIEIMDVEGIKMRGKYYG